MSIAKTYTAQLIGLQTEIVTVEVDISNGLHAFSIVGLGDRSVDEARDRVSAAIKNTGYVSPKQKNQKVVVSLAPADVRKEGPSFDLAIALAYLKASNDMEFDSENTLFFGELSLEGRIRRVPGILPILCEAPKHGFRQAFIPKDNEKEASLARGLRIYAISSLEELIYHFNGHKKREPIPLFEERDIPALEYKVDMKTIRGHDAAKRGLMVAAAGAHNLIMYGPPGTGKTMLAQAFISIMPPLSYEQSVEVTGIHSAARALSDRLIMHPPFRSPHHTASYAAIVGGGGIPKPGEITLAHRGVLFMDEFPEFDRSVIEALRQPLEERSITISRAKGVMTFPAQCILLASMNPCPCGKGRGKGCTCPQHVLETYRRKISGPISDRLDIWLDVHEIDYERLADRSSTSIDSAAMRRKVVRAREIQLERFRRFGIDKAFNGEMDAKDIEKMIEMTEEAREALTSTAKRLDMSARSFHRVLKVARTIADLAEEEVIGTTHVLEAMQYRKKAEL